MKVLLVLCLVGLAFAMPKVPSAGLITTSYHETIGIPAAKRIKAAEEAINFDGTRIVGGSTAAIGDYPHFGGLIISLSIGSTSVCGSSLITNTKGVTAAHCWFDGANQALQFEVVFGSALLFSGGTRMTTSDVVLHENWNTASIQNDIAVYTVGWVTYSATIRSIALPTGNLLQSTFVGQFARACGFGLQADGQGITTAQTLNHATLQVITNAECQIWYGSSVVNSNICIDGSSLRSTCSGDSGGPLSINSNGQDVLIGVTSFGYRWGCEQGWPAAFARVTSYAAWINARL